MLAILATITVVVLILGAALMVAMSAIGREAADEAASTDARFWTECADRARAEREKAR